jgi:hypothetical protein
MTALTIAEFREAMPSHIRKNISSEVVAEINAAISDPEVLAVYRENVVGLSSVMKEGRFKIHDYLSAVKFVSYRLLSNDQISSWSKTFPDRYNDMISRGCTRSEIASVCSRYAASKLVILLMGQTMMPTHILNAPLFQEALNVQAELMRSATSEKVRCEAAANLLATLKPPEVKKVELSLGIQEDESIAALRASTMELVRMQQDLIKDGGASVRTIAECRLVGVGATEEGSLIND